MARTHRDRASGQALAGRIRRSATRLGRGSVKILPARSCRGRPALDQGVGAPQVRGRDRTELSAKVVRIVPASTSRATSSSSLPCSAMSGVSNSERVNMSSQWIDTLLRLNGETSSGRVVDQREAALWCDQRRDLGEVPVGVGGREHERRRAQAQRRDLGRQRLAMVDDVVGTQPRHQAAVSGREAVAITVTSVSCRASWIAIEPTPPAPPTISSAWAAPGTGRADVEPVEQRLPGGDRGQRQGRRLGERQRGGLPADDPLVDQVELGVAAGPRSRRRRRLRPPAGTPVRPRGRLHRPGGVPAQHLPLPRLGRARIRTLVSTGFTDTASTRTSRSRPAGSGRGSSMSSRASGRSIGPAVRYPTAFISQAPLLRVCPGT